MAVYFGTAWLCFRVERELVGPSAQVLPAWQLRVWWLGLSVLLVLLGINKQLDLQTLFTIIARSAARSQGWYEQRKTLQVLFIVAVAACSLLVSVGVMVLLRRWLRQLWLGIAGLAVLLAFVLIRAASFHHVDRLLGLEVLGLRFNWIMELGALCMIARCALRGGAKPPMWMRPHRRNRLGREEIPIRVQVRPPSSDGDSG